MTTSNIYSASDANSDERPHRHTRHAVSWSSVVAGSLVIMATAFLMSILGVAIGFSGIALLTKSSATAAKIGVAAVSWMIVTQWISSAFGGYITGRLRSRWYGIHPHESYFRDTAHGLLAWCLAAVLILTLSINFSAMSFGMIASAARPRSDHTQESADEDTMMNASDYALDRLLRVTPSNNNPADTTYRTEISRIFANGLMSGQLPTDDRSYLTQIVAAHDGIDTAEADRRISAAWTAEQARVDTAKQNIAMVSKETSKLAVYTFLSLLIGMFIASVAAALGGAHREEGWGYKKL